MEADQSGGDMTAAISRGRFDYRAPSFRIQLHAQAPLVQGALFGDVEPRTEPPCDHPEAGWQKDIFGDVVYCCTFCGAELPEPEVGSKTEAALRRLRRREP